MCFVPASARGSEAQAQQLQYHAALVFRIIEVGSQTDRPGALRTKLERCRRLGAGYVLLLDPYRQTVWRDGTMPEGFFLYG